MASPSIKISGAHVHYFNEAGKIVEKYQIIGPDQNYNEVIKDAVVYTLAYEISGETDIVLPDGTVVAVPIKETCKLGKQTYRRGDILSRKDIMHLRDEHIKASFINILDRNKCGHIILIACPDGKHRAFPFFKDSDIKEIPELDVEFDTNDE